MNSDHTQWPGRYRAAVSITMDNMGEAAELYRGTWPAEAEVGSHVSVTESLPRILSLLESIGIRATYFVEGWNAGVYPEAIESIAEGGHEVAFHGWQHEPWSSLQLDEECESFKRGVAAFERLGHSISGFRPPGGVLTDATPDILRSHGFTYCSPAGTTAAIDNGLAYLPFDWQGIDAYYYSEGFAGLRNAKGDDASTLSPPTFQERVRQLVDRIVASGGYTALLFHPFLETEQDRFDAMSGVLEYVVGRGDIWCVPCREVAAWVSDHPDEFGEDPGLDTTSWSR